MKGGTQAEKLIKVHLLHPIGVKQGFGHTEIFINQVRGVLKFCTVLRSRPLL